MIPKAPAQPTREVRSIQERTGHMVRAGQGA
jgi:hypothetical protein